VFCIHEGFVSRSILEVGRTEQVRDSLNPDFVTKVELNFNFEMVQKVRFDVWDIDPVGKDFLGRRRRL